MPKGKIERLMKFELDIRALQRSILPYVVLTEIEKSGSEGIVGLRLRDNVIARMEKSFPSENLIELSLIEIDDDQSEIYEFHISVLYPMLEYLKKAGFIEINRASKYALQKLGKESLIVWKKTIQRLTLIIGDNDVV